MEKDMYLKICVVLSLLIVTLHLPMVCMASSEKGEEFVQLRQGEGRIEKIEAEGILIDDLYFSFAETTKYVNRNVQYTDRGYFSTGMHVRYLINLDETVNSIYFLDISSIQKEADDLVPSTGGTSEGDGIYQEGGVWKN